MSTGGYTTAFDNTYPNRKDWRRPYRGSKAFDNTCRNHGSCSWCTRNRTFATIRRQPTDIKTQIQIYEVQNGESQIENE